jgi:hypothetical protein
MPQIWLLLPADWKKATQRAAIAVSPDFRPRVWWCPDDSSSSSSSSGRVGLLFGCENAVVQVGGVCTLLLYSNVVGLMCEWRSVCATDMAVASKLAACSHCCIARLQAASVVVPR